jgi:hypothetical protein
MMKRIKNTIIRSYNKGGVERDNLLLMLNMNIHINKRPTKNLDDILRIIDAPDYSIGFYEFEIMCEYIDVNCVIMGKASSIFIDNLYYINANSDVFVILNSLRSPDNTHDMFYPVIRYKDGKQQYLYHEKDLPKNINDRIS